MTTNLIQPFGAIPIRAVAGLRFGDILGYYCILSGLLFLFNLLLLLMVPLQM
jgi:short subunit fatty acids transporter